MTTKEKNNKRISCAFELLTAKKGDGKSQYGWKLIDKDGFIDKSYSGQIAAFSVSVAMVGLKPTLAMYYEQGGSSVNTRNIVGLVAEMLVEDGYPFKGESPADKFFDHVMGMPAGKEGDKLRKDVIDNAVALKVVVRTFLKSENDEESA